MTRVSPLRKLHQQAEAAFTRYGLPRVAGAGGSGGREGPGEGGGAGGVEIVETYGDVEAEYAAVRDGCILLDMAQRGTIRVTGADRLEFLNRMLTQELKGTRPFQSRRSFWLNRKGRIDADLRLIETENSTLFDVDVSAVARVMETLGAFLVTEEVELSDETERRHRLALHGPTALAALRSAATHVAGASLDDLAPGMACLVKIAGREAVVDRQDSTGEIGLELLMETAHVADVYHQLLEAGVEHNGAGGAPGSAERVRGPRPAGWNAYNTARLEAGTPLYTIDFGAESLPHETGVLEDRVSFKKGCYLGQEVVARMQSLGHPKQRLAAVLMERQGGAASAPKAGDRVHLADKADADAVGVVTSGAISPKLNGAAICFAQVRFAHTAPGTRLTIETDGVRLTGGVQGQLSFWKRGA